MLNTIMALWNHNPGENRQRIVKVLFTFLLIGVSVSLFLFTLNSSAWSPFAGTQTQPVKKEDPTRTSTYRNTMASKNTPVSTIAVAGSNVTVAGHTPTVTPTSTRAVAQSCVPTPTVVLPQQAPVEPQRALIYSENTVSVNKHSAVKKVHSKVVRTRIATPEPGKGSEIKVAATSVPQTKQTIEITVPAPPIPVTAPVQPTITPVATVLATATSTSIQATVVSGMPDGAIMSATPAIAVASPISFKQNVLHKVVILHKVVVRIPVAPLFRGSQKSVARLNKPMPQGNAACSGSIMHKSGTTGTALKVKQHVGMLLGGVLLGTLMFLSFAFVRRRED